MTEYCRARAIESFFFLMVLEGGSPNSNCWRILHLGRAGFSAGRGLASPCIIVSQRDPTQSHFDKDIHLTPRVYSALVISQGCHLLMPLNRGLGALHRNSGRVCIFDSLQK